jgi:hypothetical protein
VKSDAAALLGIVLLLTVVTLVVSVWQAWLATASYESED